MFLTIHSYFSFNYGINSIERWLELAANQHITLIALTDINNTSGVADFVRLSKEKGIKPIVGVDIRNENQRCYTLLAANNNGYYHINRWLSQHLHDEIPFPKRAPLLPDTFAVYPFAAGTMPFHPEKNEYLGLELTDLSKFRFSNFNHLEEKCILLQPATFEDRTTYNLHRLLRAIGQNALLSQLRSEQTAPPTHRLYPTDALNAQLKLHEAEYLSAQTNRLLQQCSIDFQFGVSQNKRSFTGDLDRDYNLLRNLAFQGFEQRYIDPEEGHRNRLEKELETIRKLGFCTYFLINWDIIQYARRRGFFYVGRGSGANSIVAYCLRITDVDPIELDLYFERFINPHRANPPDFDIDFSWKDRDEIFRYLFNTYGKDHVVLLGAYSTYQHNAVLRELGKVFGLPAGEIEQLQQGKPAPSEEKEKLHGVIRKYALLMKDMPHHLTVHACGVLISEKPIYHYTATNLPPKGFPVTQFSMLEAEDLGLFKYDILSQRGLGHIRDGVQWVAENQQVHIDIHDVHAFKLDPKIRQLLMSGKTMGCFYVESPGMRGLLAKLRCEDYLTLVAASSIIRPGVARSGMMRAYIQRHRSEAKRKDAHPSMLAIMPDTYGIMVYQEDVIKVAHLFAGLGLDESDVLRRGMSGKFRSREEFQKVKDRYFECCKEKGHSDALALEVWLQIESFAGYSFAKGHSASFAVESYQSLYLKAHFPLEFLTAVINNFGGFYRTEFYVHEARMYGASIEAPCINQSGELTSITGKTIWLGLGLLQGLEKRILSDVIDERIRNGVYAGLEDFLGRVSINLEQLKILIRIGAFRFTGRSKKELLWEAHRTFAKKKVTAPAAALFKDERLPVSLPQLASTLIEDAMDELDLLGFPLCNPFHLIDHPPLPHGTTAEMLKKRKGRYEITGYLVTVKPVKTVQGERMYFGTFLDCSGQWIDTTHFPESAAKFKFQGQGCYRLKGEIDEDFGFPTLVIDYMEKLAIQSPIA